MKHDFMYSFISFSAKNLSGLLKIERFDTFIANLQLFEV